MTFTGLVEQDFKIILDTVGIYHMSNSENQLRNYLLKKTSIWEEVVLSETSNLSSLSVCLPRVMLHGSIKTLCYPQRGFTPHPYLTQLTEHIKSTYDQRTVSLLSLLVKCSISNSATYLFFPLGTVWPSIRRLWKGSPFEWGELQSTVQKSKILEGDGETSRGLWDCCQMFSSSASGRVWHQCVFIFIYPNVQEILSLFCLPENVSKIKQIEMSHSPPAGTAHPVESTGFI